MKKVKLNSIVVLVLFCILMNATLTTAGVVNVNSDIKVDTTWTSDNIYHIMTKIDVGKTTKPVSVATLTIEPGTVVKFDDRTSLTVASNSTLIAKGTATKPITFTSLSDPPESGDYRGITNYGDGEFEYCQVYYAKLALNCSISTTATIQHNVLRYCKEGISVGGSFSSLNLYNNLICGDGSISPIRDYCGIRFGAQGSVSFKNNTVDNFQTGFYFEPVSDVQATIRNSLFSRCDIGIFNDHWIPDPKFPFYYDNGSRGYVSYCGFYDNDTNFNEGTDTVIVWNNIYLATNPYEIAEEYYLYQDCELIDAGYDPSMIGMPGFTTSVTGIKDVPPVDIGYHYRSTIWYVDCEVDESGDGKSWETAFKTLNEALWDYGMGEPWDPPNNDELQAGDEIWVADGVYNLTETVAVYDDVRVYGGFRGKDGEYPGETERSQRDWKANLTIIDGGYDIYDIYAGCRCLHVYADCTIDGLIIAHGRGRNHIGGGMFIAGNPNILNCGFLENAAISADNARGGAIYKSSGSPLIKNCWFSRNDTICIGTAGGSGGAMYNYGGSPVLMNCLVAGNKAKANAGIFNWGSDAVVVNCGFFGNTCTVNLPAGGAASITNRDRDTIGSNGTILNCTFSRNFTHEWYASEVHCDANSDSIVSNCVFWESFVGQAILYNPGIEVYAGGSYDPSIISYCRVHAYKEENGEPIWILGNFVETYASTLTEEDPKFNGVIFNGTWTSNAAYDGICKTTLVNTNASWIPGQLEGKIIDLHTNQTTEGSGLGTEFYANTHYIVASNTETTVTVWGDARRAREFRWSYDPEWIIWYDIGQDGHDYWIYDFNLQPYPTSPCVDTGDPATSSADVGDKDLADNDRFVDGDGDMDDIIDMGAYEYYEYISPVAHWKLDETEGSIAFDSSGNNNDGTLENFPTDDTQWVTGQINGALEFDGEDDYVQITDYKGITGSSSRTSAAWIKGTGNGGFLTWGTDSEVTGDMWMFRINSGGYPTLGVYGGSMISSEFVADGEWHHVAAVLVDDGSPKLSEILLYVDGILDEDPEHHYTDDIDIDTGDELDVLLGARLTVIGTYGPGYYEGILDDVRIYDRALSEAEIENLAGM